MVAYYIKCIYNVIIKSANIYEYVYNIIHNTFLIVIIALFFRKFECTIPIKSYEIAESTDMK